jgi:site-specific DNA-cytosine methylase
VENKRNYLDLFSGIGGFPLALEMLGVKYDRHFFSDIEPYPCKLYAKRFPDAVALGDITKIDFKKLKEEHGTRWIITGGFP